MCKKTVLFVFVFCFFSSCALFQQTGKSSAVQNSLKNDSKQFYYYYYQALGFQEDKRYDKALESFLFCYQIDSLSAGLNSDLAAQYAVLGLRDAAKRHYKKSVELDPTNWWIGIQLVHFLMEQEEWSEAIDVAVDLQKQHPQKPEIYSVLGTLYTQTNELEKAVAVYDKLEAIVGVNEHLAILKYKLLFLQEEKRGSAIGQIERLIDKYPTEVSYLLLLGDVYLQDQKPEKAFEIFEKAFAEEPENPLVYLSLLKYYDALGDYESLSNLIVLALKKEDLAIAAKITLLGQYVEILVAKGKKIDETEGLIKLLIKQYPYEEELHLYYALFLKYQKRDDDFLKQMETILSINKKNESVWLELIKVSFAKQDYSKALDISLKAIESLPEVSLFYFYKALAQAQLKEYSASLATSYFLMDLLEESDNKELKSSVYSHIGDLYYKSKEREKAFENYEKALDLTPDNVYLMNNYAYYLSEEKKDLRRAESLSVKTIEKEPNNSTFLDTYAWILYQQESYFLAKFYIERAVENFDKKGEESGVVLDHYGDILWMNGEKEKAVEIWKEALKNVSDSEELTEKIKEKILNKELKKH